MSGQKPLHILKTSKYWSVVQKFLDDESQESLELPPSVNSTDRDVIRQICKHFDVPFKVSGEGTEKVMMIRKPDFSYLNEDDKGSDNILTHQLSEIDYWKSLACALALQLQLSREGEDIFKPASHCARCTQNAGELINKNCGHIVCASCGQEEKCAVCGKYMGELVSLEERDAAKRHRSE